MVVCATVPPVAGEVVVHALHGDIAAGPRNRGARGHDAGVDHGVAQRGAAGKVGPVRRDGRAAGARDRPRWRDAIVRGEGEDVVAPGEAKERNGRAAPQLRELRHVPAEGIGIAPGLEQGAEISAVRVDDRVADE